MSVTKHNLDEELDARAQLVLDIIGMQPGLNQRKYAEIISKRHRLMAPNTAYKYMRELRAKGKLGVIRAKKGGMGLYPAENVAIDIDGMLNAIPAQVLAVEDIVGHLSEDYAGKPVNDKTFLIVDRLTMCFKTLNVVELATALGAAKEDRFKSERQKLRQLLQKTIRIMMKDEDSALVSPRVVLGALTNQPRIPPRLRSDLKYYPPSDPWWDLAVKHIKKKKKGPDRHQLKQNDNLVNLASLTGRYKARKNKGSN